LHCICVCDCDGRHESLIMLSHSVMVRRSHLLVRCYLGTMCMSTTPWLGGGMRAISFISSQSHWYFDIGGSKWFQVLVSNVNFINFRMTLTVQLNGLARLKWSRLILTVRHLRAECLGWRSLERNYEHTSVVCRVGFLSGLDALCSF
jgi:hypothetical protein